MGVRSDLERQWDMENAKEGPLVAAAPGHFMLDARHPKNQESILAWRVGERIVLPVMAYGC
jgi:hypothetical protein